MNMNMNMNPGPGPGPGRPQVARPGTAYFKTKLCSMFAATGACPYGDHCSFAHGEADMREVPQLSAGQMFQRKTRPCNKWNTPAGCPYGDSCNFLHGEAPPPFALTSGAPGGRGGGGDGMMQRAPPTQPVNYKTRLCVRFESGNCPFGEKCHFAHGQVELRDIKTNMSIQNNVCPPVVGGDGKAGVGGESGQHRAGFNPPNAPVSFLFARKNLDPKPIELVAPPLDPESFTAKVREANKQKCPEEWLEQGGSDIYGDKVNHLVAM